MARIARFFEQNLADNARARSYVSARGIDAKTSAKFALGYAPDSWDALLNRFGAQEEERRQLHQLGMIIERDTRGGERAAGFYDRFRDRLMFPIRDSRGRVIGFGGRIIDQGEPKYLNSPETPLFHKGRELYGLYEARQARADFTRLMIVEGYMDVVRLHQAGITYAVATLGTATTQEHLNKIFRLTSEVVFCFDGDRAGRQAAWRALENSLGLARDGRELKFMFLPEGHDPDTLVAAEGARSIREPAEHRPSPVRVSDPTIDGRRGPRPRRRPRQAQSPGGAPVCPHARRHLPGNAGRSARRAGQHARGDAQEVLHGRRGEAAAHGPPGTHGPAPRSNQRWARQFADAGHHPGPASPRGGGARCEDPEALGRLDKPGVAVLKELLTQAAAVSNPSTAMLLERWRDLPEYDRLAELAMAEPLVADPESAAKELQMAVAKLLEEYGPGRRMDELLRKAEELGLNYEEKAELSLLLKSKGRSRATP